MTDGEGPTGQPGSTRLAPAHAAECPNCLQTRVFTPESPGYPTIAVTQTTGREGTRVNQGKWLAREHSKL